MDSSEQENKRRDAASLFESPRMSVSYEQPVKDEICIDETKLTPSFPTLTRTSFLPASRLKQFHFIRRSVFTGNFRGEDPINYFDFFFTEFFLHRICTNTNNHAEKLLQQPGVSERLKKWKRLSIMELKTFLGLLFHMGTIKLNNFSDYWKRNRLFQFDTFNEYMSRNRFLMIVRCLKFTKVWNADSEREVAYLVAYFNRKMLYYYPGRELLFTDNVLIRNRRVRFDFQNKLNRRGFKFFTLYEPDGLIVKLHAYTGNETRLKLDLVNNIILRELIKEKLNMGHALYTKACYQGYTIAKELLRYKIYYTGVVQNPPAIYKETAIKTLNVGECESKFHENVHIGTWRSKKIVSFITTEFDNKVVTTSKKNGKAVQQPEVVAKFTEIMTATERDKEMIDFYPCERKMMKTPLKASIHILYLMMLNAYKLYNNFSTKPKKKLKDFRYDVINLLLTSKLQPVSWAGHTLSNIEKKIDSGKIRRKVCQQCFKKDNRKKVTIWFCPTCKRKPHLCVECFYDYHAELFERANKL